MPKYTRKEIREKAQAVVDGLSCRDHRTLSSIRVIQHVALKTGLPLGTVKQKIRALAK